jgi:RNA polymerase sigma-70 factor (ECF subfamily)
MLQAGAGAVLKALTQRWQTRVSLDAGVHQTADDANAAVIEALLAQLLPSVRRWVYRRLGPDMAVDDVTQEALTEIARALPKFEGHGSLSAYAYRICARVVARHLRGRLWRRDALAAAPMTSDPDLEARDPERTAIEREALRAVLACLDRLPAKRREVFILCELEGVTPQEAAELLGTTPNAVRSLLMHARRELDRRLRGSDLLARFRGAP